MNHPVEQIAGALIGRGVPGQVREISPPPDLAGVADHREDEVLRGGRHRAQADLDRQRGSVLTQPGEPGPFGHRPGLRRPVVAGPVAVMSGPHVGRDERVDRQADQFLPLVAEHLRAPLVDQGDPPLVISQRQAVAEGVDQLPQDGRGDGSRTGRAGPDGRRGCSLDGSRPMAAASEG